MALQWRQYGTCDAVFQYKAHAIQKRMLGSKPLSRGMCRRYPVSYTISIPAFSWKRSRVNLKDDLVSNAIVVLTTSSLTSLSHARTINP